MRGKFSQRVGLWRWRDQSGGRLGHPQGHGLTVGDKDIAHTVRARARREQRKAATAERMAGVGDLDFCPVVERWVVDRGIKMFSRLITLTMNHEWPHCPYSPPHCANG